MPIAPLADWARSVSTLVPREIAKKGSFSTIPTGRMSLRRVSLRKG
jgi:hypothetical protein